MICRIAYVLLFAMTGSAVGCGSGAPEIASVSGTVTLGGKPAVYAVVRFASDEGFAAYATTDSEGRYMLRSEFGGGIPLGRYKVAVTPQYERDAAAFGQSSASIKSTLSTNVPPKYHDFATSGLSSEVMGGSNTVDFTLP